MKIVVDINHPAHVHYFKNFIWEMDKKGHEVVITASEKDITTRLLEAYNLEYINVGSYGTSLLKKFVNIPLIDLRYYRIMRNINPDIFIGFGSIRAAHIAYALGKPCINFEDTEHSTEQIRLYLPFVSAVCTPSCYTEDLGEKHVRFTGYMELGALHPNCFTPNPDILEEIGLTKDDLFIIVRFVSWEASHDIGQHGIRDKIGFVKELEQYGRVLITSEGTLPTELEKYKIRVSPEKLHDLLYYATLYVGEGATTASECAILGTHAVYVNTLRLGYTDEQEQRYGLVKNCSNPETMGEEVYTIVHELLNTRDLKAKGKEKRRKLLQDKIDVTAFMVDFIEQYPENLEKYAINDPKNSEDF